MEKVIATVDRPNGEQIQARLSEFKGQTYLSVRVYYEDRSTEEMKPGRNGINLPLSEAPEFFRLVEALKEDDAVIDALHLEAATEAGE